MNQIHGHITLTADQKQTVKTWFETNYKVPTPSAEGKQPIYTGMYDPNIPLANDPDFEIWITEAGLYFSMSANEGIFAEDTLFGLSKDIFAHVKTHQRFIREQYGFREIKPEDVNNCINDMDVNFGAFYSSANKHWYETDKRWKNRVYTVGLLVKRLEQAAERSYVTTLADMLTTASSGLQEYHEPITIKMILDHLDDADLNQQVNDILQDIINSNIARIDRFKEFKKNMQQYQLSKDFEGDELTLQVQQPMYRHPAFANREKLAEGRTLAVDEREKGKAPPFKGLKCQSK